MTPHQIIAVALRLFAVWLGLQALTALPSFFTLNGFHSPNFGWMTFMLAITAVVIFVLWVFPRTIAGKLLPPSEPQPASSATPDVWLAVGCTLLGLWTLITTVPRLVYDSFAFNSMSYYEDRSQLRQWVIYNLLRLAIAVWLLLGAKGVRKIFWWAQNVGVRKDL